MAGVRVVLVKTTLPANIGSVARAMKTMGLGSLVLVNPKFAPDDTALATAAGAVDVLAQAMYANTLEDALKDTQLSFALSSRTRSLPYPLVSVRQAGRLAIGHAFAALNKPSTHPASIAFVFGREDSGLTNDELALCNYHATIPANDSYGVLNLAAATQVVAYELRMSALDALTQASLHHGADDTGSAQLENNTQPKNTTQLGMTVRTNWDAPAATHGQMTQLEERLLALATKLDIYNPKNPRKTQARLKRLLARTQLDAMEYNLLRAMTEKAINKDKAED